MDTNSSDERQEAPERFWLIPSPWGFLPQATKPTKSEGVEYVRADLAATRMREACLGKVRAKVADLSRTGISTEQNAREIAVLNEAANELESLTLEVEKKQ